MTPPWLRCARCRVSLTAAAMEHLATLQATTGLTADVVLDAAVRLASAHDVETILKQDLDDVQAWSEEWAASVRIC